MQFLTANWMMFVVVAMIILATSGLVFGIYTLFNPTRTSSDRLRDMTGAKVQPARDEAVEKIAQRLGQLANPSNEDEKTKLRLEMVQAGYTSRSALELYNATRAALAIALPVLLLPAFASAMSMTTLLAGTLVFASLGYYLPIAVLGSQIAARQKKILHPFPDALDLLVSSVEAGLGLDAAFRRVADEMEAAAPELAREFQLVNHEISAGVPRIESLKHLAGRTGLDEIGSLVNMLTQAERFGTSIARSLRVHASITRQKRMSKAEEEAAKVSPKLTIIMILFLLPCLITVLLGPAIVNIKNSMFQ